MSVVNRSLVTARMESGDTVDVSMKVTNRGYSAEEVAKLESRIDKEIVPVVDDTIHYQVRTWSGNGGKERKNWARIPNLEELRHIVHEVMTPSHEEVSA